TRCRALSRPHGLDLVGRRSGPASHERACLICGELEISNRFQLVEYSNSIQPSLDVHVMNALWVFSNEGIGVGPNLRNDAQVRAYCPWSAQFGGERRSPVTASDGCRSGHRAGAP